MQNHELRGKLLENQPLAEFTSWRVGGPADFVFIPTDIEDLALFLRNYPQNQPLYWLGLGSNTLVRDKGVRGTVIITQAHLHQLSSSNELTIRAEAGVACPTIARYSARLGLQGIEFLAGIPGTIGGALAMNAGCHGGETWEYVTQVETIDRQGKLHFRSPLDYEISYRKVKRSSEEWFVAAYFSLTLGSKEQALEKIRSLLAHRTATQPTSEPNCGSVFRNPPGDYAARLIETSGLKGKQIGGARVSPKHANFITHDGTASAKDIENLIETVAYQVEQTHGIRLIREVCIIGEN